MAFKVGDKVKYVGNTEYLKEKYGIIIGFETHRGDNVARVNFDDDAVWKVFYYEIELYANNHQTIQPTNKYSREIKPNVFVDVYDVLRAFEVGDPCLSHLAKKALCAGLRGHKNRLEDLLDIKASIERAIEMHKEWNHVTIYE